MQCWIELSRGAIEHNHKIFLDILGEDRFVPILKSNAYGHGLVEIYKALPKNSLHWLGVNYLSEAAQLRDLGYTQRILIVGPLEIDELEQARSSNVDLLIGNSDLLNAWCALSGRPKAHIKVDTGLSRRGFSFEELEQYLPLFQSYASDIVGVATHFANVEDVTKSDFANLQLTRLLKAANLLKDAGLTNLLVHAASSASTLLMKEARLDLCRIGISLYGFWPSEKTRLSFFSTFRDKTCDLKSVLTWRTRLNSIREIKAGDFVGYGCAYKASRKIKVGLIPVGYYEGYPRLASGRGAYVLVGGQRCPVLGRICMNMSMIQLDDVPEAAIGDVVTLIGQDQSEEINAEQLAGWAETIHYEVLTRLHPAIPRKLVD